jgi:hypothetical protein
MIKPNENYKVSFPSMDLQCVVCGALVGDYKTHDEFHERLNNFSKMAAHGDSAYSMQQPLGGTQ